MKNQIKLEKEIAEYEEEIRSLQKKLKQSQDNLFCAKAELQQLDVKINFNMAAEWIDDIFVDSNKSFNEKEFWENRTQSYLQETKHIDKWKKKKSDLL